MQFNVKNLTLRNGIYWYRRSVPPDIRESVGKTEWTQSLKLRQPDTSKAHFAADRLNRHYDRIIEAHRGEAGKHALKEAYAERLRDIGAIPSHGDASSFDWDTALEIKEREAEGIYRAARTRRGGRSPEDVEWGDFTEAESVKLLTMAHNGSPDLGMPVSVIYEEDKEYFAGERDEKPISVAVAQFIEFCGDRDIREISRSEVQKFIAYLKDSRGQKASTVRRRIGALGAVVGRALLRHEIERRNPFERAQIQGGGPSSADRLPFHHKHLGAIRERLEKPQVHRSTKAIIYLLTYTGCRPLEIGALEAADVQIDEVEHPHLLIRLNASRRASPHRLKNRQAERRVPLIGPALEVAREAKAQVPTGALFPTSCHNSSSLSQRLNKVIYSAGVPKGIGLSAYSFRHTSAQALRDAGVSEHLIDKVQGRAAQRVGGRYGSHRAQVSEMKKALIAAVPFLGKVDQSIFE